MTRFSCPSCRLRFANDTAAHITACPTCGGPLVQISAEDGLGLRLFAADADVHPLRKALAAMLPVPPSDDRRLS